MIHVEIFNFSHKATVFGKENLTSFFPYSKKNISFLFDLTDYNIFIIFNIAQRRKHKTKEDLLFSISTQIKNIGFIMTTISSHLLLLAVAVILAVGVITVSAENEIYESRGIKSGNGGR